MLKSAKNQYSGVNTLAINIGLLIATILVIIQLTLSLSIAVVDMDSTRSGSIKINWRDNQNRFSEIKSKTANVVQGHNTYGFMLWSWDDVNKISIRPIDRAGQVTLNYIVIRTLGYKQVIYNSNEHFQKFRINSNFSRFEPNSNYLLLETADGASQFEFDVVHQDINTNEILITDLLNLNYILIITALLFLLGRYNSVTPLYALLVIVFTGVSYSARFDTGHAVIAIEMQSSVKDELTVYWGDRTKIYNETNVSRIKTDQSDKIYRLRMDRLQSIDNIRIDPLNTKGKVYIKKIEISELGFNPIVLNAGNNFYPIDFLPAKGEPDTAKVAPDKYNNLKIEDDVLVLTANSTDEYFEIPINAEAYKTNYVFWFCSILLLFLTYLNFIYYGIKIFRPVYGINIARYNFYTGLAIISAILLHWLCLEDYIVSLKTNNITIDHFIEDSLVTSDPVWGKNYSAELFSITIREAFNKVWILLTTIILSIYFKRPYVRFIGLFILAIVVSYLYMDTKATVINIEMQSSNNDELKVYWSDEIENYQQNHSVALKTTTAERNYNLKIENLNNVHNIRIEPISIEGKVYIDKIEITEPGYQNILLNTNNNFYAVDLDKKSKETNKITSEKLTIENGRLVFNTKAGTDFFEVIIEPDAFKAGYSVGFYVQFIALLCAIFVFLYYTNNKYNYISSVLLEDKSEIAVIIVRAGLALVIIMIFQLAWFSEYDAHPDEKAHIDSIDYYTQYWDPPVIGDNRSLDAYQAPWGVSRLDDLGISYLLIGKFKNLLTLFIEDTVFTCRAFNSLLFIILIFLTRSKSFALFCIPLLCLPQVWYLFSYANRDGFSLFLAILLAWQIVNEKSYLQQYLNSENSLTMIRYLLLPAILLGVLSIEMSNYAIFILFCLAVLIWQGIFLKNGRRQFFLKCLIFLLLAGSVYGVRKAIDIDINGFDKQAQRLAFQEAIADPEFKPSVAGTEAGFFGLRLQQKGVGPLELFNAKWEWQSLTFKSFTGLYGNEHAEYSPEWYYSYESYLYILIALICLASAIRLVNPKIGWFTFLTLIFVLSNILMGFLYSWLYDFQPQGRYIFPLIPILMVYFFKMTPLLGNTSKKLLYSCAMLLFILAIYSFREIALKYMINLMN